MELIIWFIIMIPCSALFTSIGLYAWRRKAPMNFWSGSEVKPEEIRDVPAYNRANGLMWILFSLPLWLSTFAILLSAVASLILLALSCTVGLWMIVICYKRIYAKYANNQNS